MSKHCLLPKQTALKQDLIAQIKQQIGLLNKKKDDENIQKQTILQQRLRLISKCGQYSQTRIQNIQILFLHYCTHVFKTGRNIDFDAIKNQNNHLIIQRYFAIIQDFNLNQINHNGKISPIVDRNQLSLIFKKCSYNAKNLQLAQFINCLERTFITLFNQTQQFDENYRKKQQAKNRRLQDMKKRQQKRKEKISSRDAAIQKSQAMLAQGIEEPEQSHNAVTSDPKKKQKSEKDNQSQKQKPAQKSQKDQLINKSLLGARKRKAAKKEEIQKSFQIINTQPQPPKLLPNPHNFDPYEITDQQKIQSYMQRIGIDDVNRLKKRLRYFQSANYRYTQKDQKKRMKQQKINNNKQSQLVKNQSAIISDKAQEENKMKKSVSLIQQQYSKRLQYLKVKMIDRQVVKQKKHLDSVLSQEQYKQKMVKMQQNYEKRQKKLLMHPAALAHMTKRQQQGQNTVFFSLQMMHKSSPNRSIVQKSNPERYISSDPTDKIFLQEYGEISSKNHHKHMEGRSSVGSIVASARQKVAELDGLQSKNPHRRSVNMYKNHHYLQKFLQRKV